MTEKKHRKIHIIFEQKDGQSFQVYMAGDKERLGKIPDKDLGSTEFWALAFFNNGIELLQKAGVIKTITKPPAEKELNL